MPGVIDDPEEQSIKGLIRQRREHFAFLRDQMDIIGEMNIHEDDNVRFYGRRLAGRFEIQFDIPMEKIRIMINAMDRELDGLLEK